VWVEDAVPAGAVATGDEPWNWVSANPTPFSGGLAHQSSLVGGIHQHYFFGTADTLPIVVGDRLFAYVYLDPANPPNEVMLQWNDGTWEHRAYWGANLIPWGVDGTNSRRFMGALPTPGQWVRLEVPANMLGLEGSVVTGAAFTLNGGLATWDRSGKVNPGTSPIQESFPGLVMNGVVRGHTLEDLWPNRWFLMSQPTWRARLADSLLTLSWLFNSDSEPPKHFTS
jgi:hypothetical protein